MRNGYSILETIHKIATYGYSFNHLHESSPTAIGQAMIRQGVAPSKEGLTTLANITSSPTLKKYRTQKETYSFFNIM